MPALLASALTNSSREALSVAAAVLVALALGVIVQGRVVDEQVHPPGEWRARLVAVEILAAGIFYVAAFTGVYVSLYSLALDRTPVPRDRAAIEGALLTTAIVAFVFTIARRALPVCWPDPSARGEPHALATARWGIAVSVGVCLSSLAIAVELETGWLLLAVTLLGVLIITGMVGMGWIESHVFHDDAVLGAWLGRQAWMRVATRPVRGGPLDGELDLPMAFVPVSLESGDPRLWLSGRGAARIGRLLRERGDVAGGLELRVRKGCLEMIRSRLGSASHIRAADVVIVSRDDARLFPVEPALGLVERASGRSREEVEEVEEGAL
jgi:hypothetical protein